MSKKRKALLGWVAAFAVMLLFVAATVLKNAVADPFSAVEKAADAQSMREIEELSRIPLDGKRSLIVFRSGYQRYGVALVEKGLWETTVQISSQMDVIFEETMTRFYGQSFPLEEGYLSCLFTQKNPAEVLMEGERAKELALDEFTKFYYAYTQENLGESSGYVIQT